MPGVNELLWSFVTLDISQLCLAATAAMSASGIDSVEDGVGAWREQSSLSSSTLWKTQHLLHAVYHSSYRGPFSSNSLFFCPLQLVRRKNLPAGKKTEERLDVAFNSGAAVASALPRRRTFQLSLPFATRRWSLHLVSPRRSGRHQRSLSESALSPAQGVRQPRLPNSRLRESQAADSQVRKRPVRWRSLENTQHDENLKVEAQFNADPSLIIFVHRLHIVLIMKGELIWNGCQRKKNKIDDEIFWSSLAAQKNFLFLKKEWIISDVTLMSCHQGDREIKPKKTHRWRGVSAGWLCACVSLGRNNQACVTDRQIFLANFQFTSIKILVPALEPICWSCFLFFFFHFCIVANFNIFNFAVEEALISPPRGDMWMLCVCLGFNWISPPCFFHSFSVFDSFLCVSIITHPICCLICQSAHLKLAFPQRRHSLRLWTMMFFYLTNKLAAAIVPFSAF